MGGFGRIARYFGGSEDLLSEEYLDLLSDVEDEELDDGVVAEPEDEVDDDDLLRDLERDRSLDVLDVKELAILSK